MIILASKSPRRRELLEKLGLDFTVMTEDVDETMDPARALETEIQRVSERKARAVQSLAGPEDLIISADTVVSGLCLLRGDRCETASVTTALHFRPLSDREIDAYIATGEPMDKAGAYGIQGLASIFVDRLDGDYYNVMGLPLCTLAAMLRGFGVDIL